MQPADAVLRFIENIGRHREAEFWLALFRAQAKERFATLMIEAPVMQHAFDAVVLDLRFLARLELTPVVCLGVYDAQDAEQHAALLHHALEHAGVKAHLYPMSSNPHVNHDAIIDATRAGIIPIIPFSANTGSTVDARFDRLGELLCSLQSRKLIFVNQNGAIQQDGTPVANINLTSSEYDHFIQRDDLTQRENILLEQSRRLVLDVVPHKLLISVVSPLDVLRELFTVKGAGTMLRRGAVVHVKNNYADINLDRLRDLITHSFGRPPRPDFFERPISRIYLDENYRGAALMIDTELGGYLTKFVVDRQAQGEGIGRDLWAMVTADYPTFFWRARPSNPINAWYLQEADGYTRLPVWQVFWKGMEIDKLPAAIHYAIERPDDMGSGD